MAEQLKRDFAESVRRQLDRYPVWDPGAPVKLGDYGILRDKTLYKFGNVEKFGIKFSTVQGSATPYTFQTKGTSLIGATVGGTISPGGVPAPIKASAELNFTQGHGLFIRAQRSWVSQIDELRDVALAIRESGHWNFNWKFVSELREVDPGTIIMSSSAQSTLKIEASSDLLEQFNIGALKAGAGVSFTGEAALQVVGIVGPILIDLAYLPAFFGEDVARGIVSNNVFSKQPYERLSADPKIRDDPADKS